MANCIRCGRQLPPILFGKKICQWCVQHEAAQRGELDEDAKQPIIAAPWVRRRIQHYCHTGNTRRQRDGLYRHGAGQRALARLHWKSDGALRRELRPLHTFRRLVAIAHLHVLAWRAHAHRFQHVVPVGSGYAMRTSLRTLDVRRDLSDHGDCGGRNQCCVESSGFERGRIRRDLRTGWGTDRIVLSRRIFCT